MRTFIFFLAFWIWAFFCGPASGSPARQITVLFRFDDYSSRSPFSVEKQALAAIKKYQIPVTFGVIPFISAGNPESVTPQNLVALTKAKSAFLREALATGLVEVALHGYSHQTFDETDIKHYTEFRGRPLAVQLFRIETGKKFLEACIESPVKIFIPPWNSYDLNTFLAVNRAGLKIFSAGYLGASGGKEKLQIIPATCSLDLLPTTINQLRQLEDNRPMIVVLFHHGDLDGKKMEKFYGRLAWLKSQPDVKILSFSQAAADLNDAGQEHFMNNMKYIKKHLEYKRIYFSSEYLKKNGRLKK